MKDAPGTPVDEDDVDTAPIVFRDGARAEFGSATVEPGEEAELVLEPEDAMTAPILFVSVNPRDAAVVVLRALRGDEPIVPARSPVEHLKFGHPAGGVVSRELPVKITFVNNDLRAVRVGASLVSGGEPTP